MFLTRADPMYAPPSRSKRLHVQEQNINSRTGEKRMEIKACGMDGRKGGGRRWTPVRARDRGSERQTNSTVQVHILRMGNRPTSHPVRVNSRQLPGTVITTEFPIPVILVTGRELSCSVKADMDCVWTRVCWCVRVEIASVSLYLCPMLQLIRDSEESPKLLQ